MRVNKWLDFADRVGWTAVQAASGAALAALTAGLDWQQALTMVGGAVLVAVAKVGVAQNVGQSDLGDAIPGGQVLTDTARPEATQ